MSNNGRLRPTEEHTERDYEESLETFAHGLANIERPIMSDELSSTATGRMMTRRNALRLAFTAVPIGIGLVAAPSFSNAGATTTPQINIIDAVSASLLNQFILGTTKPTAANTGWRRVRASLTPSVGDILVTTAGTVIEGKLITGRVLVRAANVTIRQCEIVGNGYAKGNTGLVDCNHPAASNVLIEDCEIHQDQATANVWHDAIIGHDYTARRNFIYDVVDGFGVYNSSNPSKPANVAIEGNFVRDLCYFSPDPNHPDNRTHNDGIQIQGNGGVRIVGNHLRGYASSTSGTGNRNDPYFPLITGHVITCTPTVSPITDVTVSSNWLYGGVCGLIAISGRMGSSHIGVVSNNRFGKDQRVAAPIQFDNVLTAAFDGNVWDESSVAAVASYYKPGTI